jgi:hypothetical protein
MNIDFIGGEYYGRSLNLNAEVCQNLYPVVKADREGNKVPVALYGTPGLSLWLDLGAAPYSNAAAIRAMYIMDTTLYVICGTKCYKIPYSATPVATEIGNVSSSTDNAYLAGDGTNIMAVVNGFGYWYNGTTWASITDADFPTPSSMTYLDGYYIVSKSGTSQFYISALRDPSNWDALDFATKEAKSDDIRCVYAFGGVLYLFGESSTEVWYNTGNSDFPFERYQGGVASIGCRSKWSVACTDNAVYMLDDQFQIRAWNGVQHKVVSTPNIEYHIKTFASRDGGGSLAFDAYPPVGLCYQMEGHSFYQITFPHGLPANNYGNTLVYDETTGYWHRRASLSTDYRHPAQCHTWYLDKNLVGHYGSGKILYFNPDRYSDYGDYINAIRTSQFIYKEGKRIFFHKLTLDLQPAPPPVTTAEVVGEDAESASGATNPSVTLYWSDDGGNTWSSGVSASLGVYSSSEFTKRLVWRRLGDSRNRIFKIKIADAVKRTIIGASLEATVGND